MTLTTNQKRTDVMTALLTAEQVHVRCEEARQLEDAGRYEEAAERLGDFWVGVGRRPPLEGLDELSAAEVLLRSGTLTAWLGSARQIKGAQEAAKDLIGESATRFEAMGEAAKAAGARTSLAVCYWREGAIDEARVMLGEARSLAKGRDARQEARALLNLAIVESSATRYNEAVQVLSEAGPLVDKFDEGDVLRGMFHNELANALMFLGRRETRADYLDRALVEFTAAGFHYELAGNKQWSAMVENNLGFLFFLLHRHEEAREHLRRARSLFTELGQEGNVAQTDETHARLLLAEGRMREAETFARAAVERLEGGDELSLLAEALTSQGRALARLGRISDARATLSRAFDAADRAGDPEGAGQAALATIEELHEQLTAVELLALYENADDLLQHSQETEIVARLRECARKVLFVSFDMLGDSRLVPADADGEEGGLPDEFIHAEPATAELLRRAELIAGAGGPVLLSGETGTGKDMVARLIHARSGRAGRFVKLGCAGLSAEVFEARLLGDDELAGAASEADGGTLFLEEVGEVGPAGQAKLLRLLEFGEAQSSSVSLPRRVDVRVVASTSDDLARLVEEGDFRKDLYYRLQNFTLEIPPLRERPADAVALARHFAEQSPARRSKGVTFAAGAADAFGRARLKGNARELRSLIERAVLTADDGALVTPEMVELLLLRGAGHAGFKGLWDNFSLKDEVRRVERCFIELALKESNGSVSRASRLLGFKHHESLASLLKTRHRDLLHARTPAKARRRSIIPKELR
ncbi:MAG TPA: sigma 54-interacting transcriptional regulator [Pyrinomonadaceae bacterium]|nr:sigma 54-interacting transcriptional regulator [Pyrinomonadaceae bacterium]